LNFFGQIQILLVPLLLALLLLNLLFGIFFVPLLVLACTKNANSTTTMALTKEQKKKLKWQWSDAKGILFDDIVKERVPLNPQHGVDMTSKELFETRYKDLPAFAISNFGDVEKFERRLSSVRTQIRDKLQRAQEDAMALANDRLIHPVPTIDCRGYPQWRGSEAREATSD